MRLLGFNYLKIQRILTLTIAITLSSTLFSLTALSLLGFYKGFSLYLGEDENIIALYDRKSRTPFTGLVPLYLAERISVLEGVIAISPETAVPCILNNEQVFLRGVIPEEFTKLNQITIIDGEMLRMDDISAVMLGMNIAEKLGLRAGSSILILGVLKEQYLEMRIKGVFASNSVMDDEVIAPLYVGQWLRGTDYGHVTLIRFKIDRNLISASEIFEMIARETGDTSQAPPASQEPQTPIIIPRIITRFRIEDLGIEEAKNVMKNYMERYGITREALLTLSVMIFILSSSSIFSAAETILQQHKKEVEVIRSVGASKKTLKHDLLAKLLIWSAFGSAAGAAAAITILKVAETISKLQILSHTITFSTDPLIISTSIALTAMIVSISILRADLK
ncbi:MAG: ABC transporter permease [Nitrososphaerota archaeon]|nr:ABC transporter permease [Nitrososphaerota archaeon]